MYETENENDKAKAADPVIAAAKETVQELAEPLKEKALSVAKEQKDVGADQLRLLAQAVKGASEAVEDDVPQFAGYMQKLSGKLEQTSSDLRDCEMDELTQFVGDFAKRNPALVFGGALVAGLALSRILKSSTHRSTPDA